MVGKHDKDSLACLRLLAVKILSKFVKLVAETQLAIVGSNLTSVVVSLVPIFSMTDNRRESKYFENECIREGVSLIEWLTEKECLLAHFADIPFLPPTSALDSVRVKLRSRGVHYDNLHTVPVQGTLEGSKGGDDSISGDSSGASYDGSRQAALRHRLETMYPLLESESCSVRRVVLKHLTSLLRMNRDLFHDLVENEVTASLKRFVTVPYKSKTGMFTT